jgi:glutamine amidotransferase
LVNHVKIASVGLTGVVDVGLGNIASIRRMLDKVGAKSTVLTDPDELCSVERIILPGVGHFAEGMRRLSSAGFADAIREINKQNKVPILGVCLGMQLLCRQSEEGDVAGLGIIAADVLRFRFSREQRLKVPHMGWNVVSSERPNRLLPLNQGEQRFYFVHAYKVVPDDSAITIGSTEYGGVFCAAFQQGNVFGVQFHPEKSHRFGEALIRRFAEL